MEHPEGLQALMDMQQYVGRALYDCELAAASGVGLESRAYESTEARLARSRLIVVGALYLAKQKCDEGSALRIDEILKSVVDTDLTKRDDRQAIKWSVDKLVATAVYEAAADGQPTINQGGQHA